MPAAASSSAVLHVHTPAPAGPSFDDIDVGASPRRVVVLVLYILFGMCNQFMYVSFANIVDQVRDRFGCSAFAVNMLAAVYAVVYILGVFPACEVFARMGLRMSLLVGTLCNVVGGSLKFVAVAWVHHYWMLMIGQFFSAIGQVFFLSLPPMLAATWFPSEERSLATALGTLSGFLGMALGFGLAPAFVNDERHSTNDFIALFGFQLAWAAVNFCCVGVFVPAVPPRPPSVTSPCYQKRVKELSDSHRTQASFTSDASMPNYSPENTTYGTTNTDGTHTELLRTDADGHVVSADDRPHIFAQLWQLRHNGSFVALIIVFGVGAGSLTAISTILAQLFAPFGVSETQTGVMTLVGILCGCATCVVAGPLLDKYRRYRKPLIVLNVAIAAILATLGACTVVVPASDAHSFVGIGYALTIAIVAVLLPTLPIGLELSVELTYPIDEAVPSSACMWCNSFVSIVGTVAGSAVIGNNPTRRDATYVTFSISALFLVCVAVVVFLVREDRRRFESEQASSSAVQSPTTDATPRQASDAPV